MKQKFYYIQRNLQFFPAIHLKLREPKIAMTAEALIDSGASFSIFRPEIAEYLGIQIEKGKQVYLEGIGGRILGYIHEVRVSIDKCNFFKCKIVFSREFHVSFNLLGRDNFFKQFIISFHEKDQNVVIENNVN